MMSGLTRFYFIPLLFGSALFIIGECIDKNLSNKNHYKAMWWCSLIFSLIALLLMVLIYFFSDRNYWSKNLFGLILKDFWGRFIVLTWYNFLYCIYVLKMYTYLADLTSGNSTNNIYDEQPSIRRLTSLENWNKGFLDWKKWETILYNEASIYNVHDALLTLNQYQDSMDVTLKRTNILMDDSHNMLICGDFTAIYYDIITVIGGKNSPGTVMEFVLFKDYGDQLGTRVIVGWGG